MSSVGIVSQPTHEPLPFRLTLELLLNIIEFMSPSDATNFALTSKKIFDVFQKSKNTILTRILKSQPEFSTLLYIYTARASESLPDQVLFPRIIEFVDKEFKTDLMRVDDPPEGVPKIILTSRCILEIWHMAKVIDWWVDIYPRLHWRDPSDGRRCLRDSEAARVRMAVARWWLFANHHHGVSIFRGNPRQPMKWEDDTRMHHIRLLHTNEILELAELWRLVGDTVSKDLCSSPEIVCDCKQGLKLELVPWGADEGRHDRIVMTYMKLNPEQLRYFLIYYANCKKNVTIDAISASMRNFGLFTETLSITITKALEERLIVKEAAWEDIPRLGIVNEDRVSEDDIAQWVNDGWPRGRIPPLKETIAATIVNDLSAWNPRGDDGMERAPGPW